MMTMMQSKVNILCKGAIVNERSLQVEIGLLRWDGATKVGWGKKGRSAAFFNSRELQQGSFRALHA